MDLFKKFNLVDLTHTLDESVPTWRGCCGFEAQILTDYSQGARLHQYKCLGGIGTHMDSPAHFIAGGRGVDQLTLAELCIPICVIDMSEKLHNQAQVRLVDFQNYEKKHGKVPKKSIVVANTGWSRYWNEPKTYRGEGEYPTIPTIHSEVGDLLIERDVVGVGIDTLSPDPHGGGYPLHHLLLGADKFILENLTSLDKLPKKGAYLIALPLKIAGGSESPIRAIALVPNYTQVG